MPSMCTTGMPVELHHSRLRDAEEGAFSNKKNATSSRRTIYRRQVCRHHRVDLTRSAKSHELQTLANLRDYRLRRLPADRLSQHR